MADVAADSGASRDGTADPRHVAFARYVEPELDVLYRVAVSLTRNPTDAEDLVQDTLVRAFRAADRFDGRYPRAWLLTILRRTHLNRVRRRTPLLLADGEGAARTLDDLGPAVPSSEDVVLRAEFEPVVAAALGELSADFRAVVELVDLRGLSYEQAAEHLDIPKGTVMSRLHRARQRIRTRLDEAGMTPGSRKEV